MTNQADRAMTNQADRAMTNQKDPEAPEPLR